MKRQQRTIGAIIKIDLGKGFYSYGQILKEDIVFFDIYAQNDLVDLSILLKTPVLFYLGVYNDVITSGRWVKVGKLSIKEEFEIVPLKFIQDSLKPDQFEIYDPNSGEIRKSTKAECKGLECAAVWEAEEVEERLRDHFSGRPNRLRKEDLQIFE